MRVVNMKIDSHRGVIESDSMSMHVRSMNTRPHSVEYKSKTVPRQLCVDGCCSSR